MKGSGLLGKLMPGALEGLLLVKFSQNQDHPFSTLSTAACTKIDTLLQEPSSTSLDDVLADPQVTGVIQKYLDFRHTDLGKTAKLWLSYVDHVHLLLALIESVKTNNYPLHVQAIKQMSPLSLVLSIFCSISSQLRFFSSWIK